MSVAVLTVEKGKMCARTESIEEPPTFPEISDSMLEQALRQIPQEKSVVKSHRKKRGSVESESDFASLTGSGMFSERTGSAKRLKLLQVDRAEKPVVVQAKQGTTGKRV